jgi:hypothetical protein
MRFPSFARGPCLILIELVVSLETHSKAFIEAFLKLLPVILAGGPESVWNADELIEIKRDELMNYKQPIIPDR